MKRDSYKGEEKNVMIRIDYVKEQRIKLYKKGIFQDNDGNLIEDPEISLLEFYGIDIFKEYKPHFQINSNVDIHSLFQLYLNVLSDEYNLNLLIQKINGLNYFQLFDFLFLVLQENQEIDTRIIESLECSAILPVILSQKSDDIANFLITEILTNSRSMELYSRYRYLLSQFHLYESSKLRTDDYNKAYSKFEKYYQTINFIDSNGKSKDLKRVIETYFDPDNIFLKVWFCLRSVIADYSVKLTVINGWKKEKIKEKVASSKPILLGTDNYKIPISLTIFDFETWKEIIESDITKIIAQNVQTDIESLKDQTKVAINDFHFQTGVDEFFNFTFLIFDYRNEKKTSLAEINAYFENLKIVNSKDKIQLHISPKRLSDILQIFFKKQEIYLSEQTQAQIKKFILNTCHYDKGKYSFGTDEEDTIQFLSNALFTNFCHLLFYLEKRKALEIKNNSSLTRLLKSEFDYLKLGTDRRKAFTSIKTKTKDLLLKKSRLKLSDINHLLPK